WQGLDRIRNTPEGQVVRKHVHCCVVAGQQVYKGRHFKETCVYTAIHRLPVRVLPRYVSPGAGAGEGCWRTPLARKFPVAALASAALRGLAVVADVVRNR